MDDEHVDTGFVTAAVTAALPAPVPAPPAPVDPNLDDHTITVLAREMAMNIADPLKVLKTHGLTQEQFNYHILPKAHYKRVFETFLMEWESATSTNKRLAIKSAIALEDGLAAYVGRINSAKETLPAVTEGAKLLAKLAGAGEQAHAAEAGEKFNIVINLGEKHLAFEETIAPTTLPSNSEGASGHRTILGLPKGPSGHRTILGLPKGPGEHTP